MTPSHTAHAQSAQRLLWVVWFALFLTLSYKKKILGEAALRPLYLLGVAYGWVLMLYLSQRAHHYTFQWRSTGEALVLSLLLAITGYVFVQSLLYPTSFNDVVYTVATIALLFGVSAFSVMAYGWEITSIAIFRALLNYSLLNIVLLILSFANPSSVSNILVPPLESGFGTRISGLPGDPTHLGSLFAITLLLMFLLRHRIPGRMIGRAVLLFGFLAVTGSRNAVLSLLLGCTVASLAEARLAPMIIRTLMALLLACTAAAVTMAVDPTVAEFVAAVFRVDDPNAYSRLDIWIDMVRIIEQMSWLERLFGGGYLYIQELYGSPYNAFLRIFFGHGLFAFLCLVAITIALFFYGSSDSEVLRRQIVLGLLTYWFTFSMFLDTAFAEFFHFTEFCFWFAAAIVTTRSLGLRATFATHVPAGEDKASSTRRIA